MRDDWRVRVLYEDLYCARGKMENRVKDCRLDVYADRTFAAAMAANQLWFASIDYVLLYALQRIGLAHTNLTDKSSNVEQSENKPQE